MEVIVVIILLAFGIIAGVWFIKDKQVQSLNHTLSQERHERQLERQAAEEKQHIAQAAIEHEKQITKERIEALNITQSAMSAHFKALSSDLLRDNSEAFFKQAAASFEQQKASQDQLFKQREQSIDSLVKPIAEALKKTEQQIQDIEKSRRQSFGELSSEIKQIHLANQQLQSETRHLVTALRRPEVRGRWGELSLKRLAELAGMIEHCDFFEQQAVDAGRLRPDMVVRMPDQRELIIDAKTPLDAYLSATETNDVEQRQHHLQRHASNVRSQVKQLAQKSYWAQFNRSPEFVVLFIPGEQFLSSALEQDNQLLEDAFKNHVVLATPSTMMALLRCVAFGWQQTAITENTQVIQKLGADLYKRITAFVGHLEKLGKNLGSSVDSYNQAIGSLERQVLPGARKFEELGIQQQKTIAQTSSLERVPRSVAHLIKPTDDG